MFFKIFTERPGTATKAQNQEKCLIFFTLEKIIKFQD